MLFLSFLLPAGKAALLFFLSLLARAGLLLKLLRLTLQLQRLLRPGADRTGGGLLPDLALHPLRICRIRPDGRGNRRTEPQTAVVFEHVGQDLIVLRLCAEGDLADRKHVTLDPLKDPDPERRFKQDRQPGQIAVHNETLLKRNSAGTDDPEGRVTYLRRAGADGWATYQLWQAKDLVRVAFLSCT